MKTISLGNICIIFNLSFQENIKKTKNSFCVGEKKQFDFFLKYGPVHFREIQPNDLFCCHDIGSN